jgi:hypothetical protein
MRITLTRGFIAAGLAALALTQTAAAASPARLLAKFQPVTQFAPGETYRATAVETFVSDSTLEALAGPNLLTDWVLVDPNPNPSSLPTSSPPLFRLNQQPCTAATDLAGAAGCYASSWNAHGAPPPNVVYGRVAPVADKIVLQYWFFYYNNFYVYPFSFPGLPLGSIWQEHEGDWEVVNVVLSAADESPLYVGYSQHCTGERRAWASTPRWRGTHPRVKVALGSHANYFSTGLHPIAVECIPPAAVQLLQQNGLPLPADVTGNGASSGPAAFGAETTSISRLTSVSAPWLAFPGFWGELEYFKSPVPIGNPPSLILPAGRAPVGPALHTVWQNPLATLAGWPVG